MPGLRLTGHEPEFPRQFTLERIAGVTEFLADSARKLRALWLSNTVPEGQGERNGKLLRRCAKGVERRKFLWKSTDKEGGYWEDCLLWLYGGICGRASLSLLGGNAGACKRRRQLVHAFTRAGVRATLAVPIRALTYNSAEDCAPSRDLAGETSESGDCGNAWRRLRRDDQRAYVFGDAGGGKRGCAAHPHACS